MLDLKPLLRALCGSFLALSACDEGPERTEDNEFRWETNQCVSTGSGSQSLVYGGKGYGPEPWDPDGDPWAPISEAPEEWVRALQDDFRGHAESVLIGQFETRGSTPEACGRACKNRGLGWNGGGCIAGGSFTYGAPDYWGEDYAGTPVFSMRVKGVNVDVGCACGQ